MSSGLLLLLHVIMAPWLGPNVRIDHQNLLNHSCCNCAITVGPGAPSSQPLYVAFEDDSTEFIGCVRSDIVFQKSTDGGRTWLSSDLLIRRGDRYAFYPDITTAPDGNVYIVYTDEYIDTVGGRHYQVSCVRSSDGGTTWTAPSRVDDSMNAGIGRARIAADSAGNLFTAWNQLPGGLSRVFSSVSTDKGATWNPRVCVDDDTLTDESYHQDVFVQPGTEHYLVAATAYRWIGGHSIACAYLYRSTDRGQTFQSGVQLDTFNYVAGSPHVVADRDHIICDYFGHSRNTPDPLFVEARTFYTQPDTWGGPVSVTNLDSLHRLYYSGTLARSADGRVHTALMIGNINGEPYLTYYAYSSDHGVSWSDLELVNEDTTARTWYPDIGADSTGHAYVVWEDFNGERGYIWFATNNPAAIAEQPAQQAVGAQQSATVVRDVLFLDGLGTQAENGDSPSERLRPTRRRTVPIFCAALLDIGGRKVMDLLPGANDVRALAPGVYFVRAAQAQAQAQVVRKVVVTR